MNRNFAVSALLAFATAGAFAQTHAASSVQRDVNQQQRIEQGLQNGKLTTREAALLEKDEAKVDRLQARSMKDGHLTAAERTQLQQAQNRASRDIKTATHNGVNGNPLSASSQRMQADVQRNVNQEQRIQQGLKSGELTKHEAAKLERGQAKVDHEESVAGRDGHVGKAEQHQVQHTEDHQNKAIHQQKHDAQERPTKG